jgi:hypothetical protein
MGPHFCETMFFHKTMIIYYIFCINTSNWNFVVLELWGANTHLAELINGEFYT